MNSITYQREPSKHWTAFLIALATAAAIFVPFVLYDRGLFIFIGDFNVQQIPFYKLAHEAVRSGDILWNWYTDLGANFIGSYSFYLIFSPFFWLTLPFPTEWVPYLMAPLLILKTACAALTSYFYIQRFTKDKNFAVIGALLYAFSGFTAYNIFFNHFHEVIVFFPLMLVGLEELLVNDRRGVFAITVAVNALVNYWFFVGEVVFIILYYFVRCTGLKGAIKKLFWVGFEGVLGCLCAAFALLPSALAVMGNPRTTLPDNALGGWQFWLYTHEQRQPGILASFFFPPETPSRPNMFPDHGAKWASLSAWLPVFSMSGVLGFLISARRNWLRKLILLCFVIAMVPGLNSLFIALNHSYYTRWFYMLILVMCAATVVALEDRRVDLLRGFRWTAIVTLVIVLALGFTPVFTDGEVSAVGIARDTQQLWIYAAVASVGLLVCCLLLVYARNRPGFTRKAIIMVVAFSVCYTSLYIGMSKSDKAGDNYIIDNGVLGRRNLDMPREGEFYRTDIYDSGDNFGMYWHLPNIQAFHSVVPVSIMKFYPEVGVKRDVSSRPEPQYYALRSLFSVKYYFINRSSEDQEPMQGYVRDSSQLDFNIYRNENFLPMGFAFDSYFEEDDFYNTVEADRHLLLLKGLLLDREQIDRHRDILTYADVWDGTDYTYEAFQSDVAARRAESCYSFEIDNRGFTARSNLEHDRLMFFSVPYEAGWSATVNGEPALIENVDIGFMAVRVPAGESEIRFNYLTPGLLPGLAVAGGAILVLVLYLLLARRKRWLREPHGYELFGPDCFFELPPAEPNDEDALPTEAEPHAPDEDGDASPDNSETGAQPGEGEETTAQDAQDPPTGPAQTGTRPAPETPGEQSDPSDPAKEDERHG